MRVRLTPSNSGKSVSFKVAEIALAFGGLGKTALRAPKTEAYLMGKEWTQQTIESAYASLSRDFDLKPQTPGGQVEFRRSLATSFLLKFYIHTALQIKASPDYSALQTTASV